MTGSHELAFSLIILRGKNFLTDSPEMLFACKE